MEASRRDKQVGRGIGFIRHRTLSRRFGYGHQPGGLERREIAEDHPHHRREEEGIDGATRASGVRATYCTVIGTKAEIRPTHKPDPESAPGIDMPVPGALVDMPGVPIPVNN